MHCSRPRGVVLRLHAEATGEYIKTFTEDHICEGVDAYFSGHDKNLQWLPLFFSSTRTMKAANFVAVWIKKVA